MPRRSSGRRTDYQWAQIGDVIGAVDPGIAARFGTIGFVIAAPQTLTRLRGRVSATLNAGAVNELGHLLFGVMVLKNELFVAGAAPELHTEAADEASWVWRGSLFLSSGSEAAIVPDQLSDSMIIDSKAMRRVKTNDTVAVVVEAPNGQWIDQAGTIDVVYDLHMLFGG